jgi:shikimate dehydrogenase
MNINSNTRYLGIIGNPLQHSLSPWLHNRTLHHLGLNYVYLPLQIDAAQLRGAVKAIRSLGFRGVNVTIPFKEKVMPWLDELSPESAACGSVNVIVNHCGRLSGHNTDGAGFMRALLEHPINRQESALLIGCGGAARAVAYQLVMAGWRKLVLLDLDIDRARVLADFITKQAALKVLALPMSQAVFNQQASQVDLIVNCTPVGMYPAFDDTPVSTLHTVRPGTVCCDIIYNPQVTRFIRMAREAGLKTVDGLSMFVYQAALSLKLWLDIEAPLEFMRGVAVDGLR